MHNTAVTRDTGITEGPQGHVLVTAAKSHEITSKSTSKYKLYPFGKTNV